MTHPPEINVPGLLRRYGLRPDKKLGQNFLIDEAALQRVADAAGLHAEDDVLEIGPGLGSLTRLLAQRSRRVVAVELDAGLLRPLAETLAGFSNVSVVQGDILALDPAQLMRLDRQSPHDRPRPYRVVANIPYYITSAVIRRLLEAGQPPAGLTLTVQREVAERITAAPGRMSLLALSVQVYGSPQIAALIPAGAFYPPPKVDSAVIRVDLHPAPRIPAEHLETFFRLAKAGFSRKRKMLRNSLAGGLGWEQARAGALLAQAGVDGGRRAESLSLDEWAALVEVYLREGGR